MTDNIATCAGFTRYIIAEAGALDLYLMVKPNVDFDSRFKAWDTDKQEWIMVNGWNVLTRDLDAE